MVILQRAAVRPFTERQIKLVESFADQAVIAIENTRLFEAEQQRTRELTESLQQQTATSEVLQVIRSSPGDLQPVFEAMLEKAVRICDASSATFIGGMASFFTFLRRSTHHQPLSKPAVHRFDPTGLCIAWWKAKRRYTLPISRRMRITLKNTIDLPQRQSNLGACGRFCLFQCSRRIT